MTLEQITAMRAYLRQWIMNGHWWGPAVPCLQQNVDGLTSMEAIRLWLDVAFDAGIDPL